MARSPQAKVSNGSSRTSRSSAHLKLVDPLERPTLRQVTFVIPGKTVSGNMYKIPSRTHGAYVTREAKSYKQLCRAIAYDAAFAAKYGIPEYCRVDVTLVNTRLDRDNACKVNFDSWEGCLFQNDSRVLDGGIRKVKDDGPERTIVTATEVLGSWYGYPRSKKSDAIISHADWVQAMLAPYAFQIAEVA